MIERTNERTNNRNATNPIGNAAETKCNVTQHIECKRKRNESNPQRSNTYNFMKFNSAYVISEQLGTVSSNKLGRDPSQVAPQEVFNITQHNPAQRSTTQHSATHRLHTAMAPKRNGTERNVRSKRSGMNAKRRKSKTNPKEKEEDRSKVKSNATQQMQHETQRYRNESN